MRTDLAKDSTKAIRPRFSPFSISYRTRMEGSAAALSSAAAATSMAETVQITLNGNFANATTNNLNPDLTGDGIVDLAGFLVTQGTFTDTRASTKTYNDFVTVRYSGGLIGLAGFSSRVNPGINGGLPFRTSYAVRFYYGDSIGSNPIQISSLRLISFNDARINGDNTTDAFLEVRAAALSPSSNTVSFVRLVFDDESTLAPKKLLAGGTNKEWLSDAARAALVIQISQQKRTIKRLIRKARKAKSAGRLVISGKITKKVRKLRAENRGLNDML